MKVFSAQKFIKHSKDTYMDVFIGSRFKKQLIEDDGKEVTPYDERTYINDRLQLVSSIFVVDKKDWKPYSKKGKKE